MGFCDDLVIRHSNHANLQAILTVFYRWAQDAAMTFNIQKCGTFDAAPFFLGDALIPKCSDYKYLGFKHERRGLNFTTSSLDRIQKAVKSLVAIKKLESSALPCWLRLMMYKTFVRPIAEYGLVLGGMSDGPEEKVAEAFNKLHMEALHWIVPGNTNVFKAKASLTGMGLSEDRIAELRGGLVAHLQTMDETNPCYLKLQSYGHGPWPTSTLLPRTTKDPLYRTFARENSLLPPDRRMTWTFYVRNCALGRLAQSKLAGYILQRARAPKSNTDMLLYHTNHRLVAKGIAWRLNRLVGSRCPHCHGPFNRRHIADCSLVQPQPAYVNEHMLKFQSDTSYLFSIYGRDFIYTWLDYSLNAHDWDAFEEMFDVLHQRLRASD